MNETWSKEKFIESYSKHLLEGKASVLIGAGIHANIGYPNWNELLKEVADELGLKISNHIDLPLLAQFYVNEKGSAKELAKILDNKLNSESYEPSESLKALVKLPIADYWTTNYDSLIEKALSYEKKSHNLVYDKSQFYSLTKKYTVFKMHGDIKEKQKIVLWKESYDAYEKERKFFWDKLSVELINKSFLFIGTSLNDPNLNLILGKSNMLIENGDQKNEHFIFFEDIKGETESEKLEKLFMEYKIKDLKKRFNINTVLLDSYDEIPLILTSLNSKILQKNIFISGAAEEYDAYNSDENKAKSFLYDLSYKLTEKKKKIISGFGKGIGDWIISGSLAFIRDKKKEIDESLEIWPFPQSFNNKKETDEIWTNYREMLINKAGIVIFVFGNKLIDENGEKKCINSKGMFEEFEIAKQKSKIIIPIASTGYATKQILEEIEKDLDSFNYLKNHIEDLKTEKNISKIIKIILAIIDEGIKQQWNK